MMHDDVRYAHPYLKEVIVRLDFVAPVERLLTTLPPRIQKSAVAGFPIAEPADAVQQEVLFGAGELHHRETRYKQWTFFGKEREKHLAIAAPFMFTSIARYESYESLKESWSPVVDAVASSLPDIQVKRFGLRYINIIEIDGQPPTDWSGLIEPQLLEDTAFYGGPDVVTRMFRIVELKHDDMDVKFQFGIPNPDYPAVIRRPQFVLDIDAYVQTAHDLGQSLAYMDTAHDRVQGLFERSIMEPLRERMNA